MPFGKLGLGGVGRFVRLEPRAQLFELRLDRRVLLVARRELLLAERQELEALAGRAR